jgi:hypothetical protein
MMRSLIFIFVFSAFHLALMGQSAEDEVIRLKQPGEVATDLSDPEMGEPVLPKVDAPSGAWNLSVGTSFTAVSGFGSGMGFYAAPTYTLPLSDRWSVHGGVIASYFTGLTAPGPGEMQLPTSYSSLALFAAASYRMSDRLVLHGAGFKQLLAAPPSPLTPYPMDHLTFGASYRLGNNITIGAAVQMNQGQGYYVSSPFYNSSFPSPFGW